MKAITMQDLRDAEWAKGPMSAWYYIESESDTMQDIGALMENYVQWRMRQVQCQGCDVPKDGVYQISEPMPADKRALMLSVTASEPFKSQLKECAARIAELEAQLAAAQQDVQPFCWFFIKSQLPGDYEFTRDGERANEARKYGYKPVPLFTHPTTQGLDAQIIQALSAGMSIEQWQSSVDVRIGSSDLLGRAIASGEETRIELVRRAVSEVFAAQAKQGGE